MRLQPNITAIEMYIANEQVVCDKTINIVEQLKNTNTTVLNNCYPLSWEQTKDYTSKFYMPKDYSLFKLIFNYNNSALMTEDEQELLTENEETLLVQNSRKTKFAGIVKKSKSMDLNPNKPHFNSFQVLDFKTFLSEGELFNFVLTDITIENAIKYVISQYNQYNFKVGNLNLGSKLNEIINNYNCNQKTLYDVLEYFAQITQSIWTTRYINDRNIAIDFYSLDSLPQVDDLIYSKEYCDNNSIISINYDFDGTDYRNKQIMTSSKIMSDIPISEQFYTSGFEYTTNELISQIQYATLNGEILTIATVNDKENGETADLYYEVGTNKFELNEQVLPGQILEIEYYSQIPGRQVAINQEEITRINNQLNNSGIITRYENREDADNSKELSSIGQSYIQFKGKPQMNLTVSTINEDLYNIGDIVFFDTNSTEGLKSLEDNYVVKKKTLQIIQNNADDTNNLFYTYELNNNYNFESTVNYFDNQRAKIIGNIKEGEYINRYVESYKNYNIIFDPPIIDGG